MFVDVIPAGRYHYDVGGFCLDFSMKVGVIGLFILLMIACGTKEVYVCDSKGARRYHLKETCKGLKNCSYRIRKTTENSAMEEGKTLCRWEE